MSSRLHLDIVNLDLTYGLMRAPRAHWAFEFNMTQSSIFEDFDLCLAMTLYVGLVLYYTRQVL